MEMDSDSRLPPDVGDCLARLAAGDLSARDRIIDLCSDRIRHLAHRMLARFPNVRRWDDTDDVFQAAAMRLHRSLGQMAIGSPRDLLALAATEIRRELIDLARKHAGPESYAANHATNMIPAGRGHTTNAVRHVDLLEARDTTLERWTIFQETVERLPDDAREVFHLVWFLGADQQAIARLLDCSERTVKTRWREAREAVKAALGGQSPEA
jgi:RNA polymerase sigma-70 factor (ECF subfamily)